MWKRLHAKRSPPFEGQSSDDSSSYSLPKAKTTDIDDSSKQVLPRSPTTASTSVLSAYSADQSTVTDRTRRRSQARRLDPLGLTVLYEPDAAPSVDVIFVHGLGGTSCQTWSKGRDPELFWPQRWLPSETGMQMARILSFGYNADFASSGPTSISGISDFAKGLLFEMRFGNNKAMADLNIGQRPLIFVAHSMGGLVVKKAYIFGQNDSDYKHIISSTKSIVFLSSPHRGTNLAEVLNRILSVSILNHSPKQYLSELARNSPALEELNEQFRHVAPGLQIFSFYETLHTPIGLKKMLILERDSSILGYPGEVSKPLNADHHHVCKYSDREDPNYISVRNALKSIVARLRGPGDERLEGDDSEDLAKIRSIVGVSEKPSDDFSFFRDRWRTGTCDWIISNSPFNIWLQDSSDFRILWINARPASGKSILTTYIVNLLERLNKQCAYFYFRFDDQSKRSVAGCLRSLVWQTAQQIPDFRRALTEMSKSELDLKKADARSIWKKVFVDVLFKLPLLSTMYWVVDALDESDSPRSLIELLTTISATQIPLKILLVSRQTPELRLAFERLAITSQLDILSLGDNNQDIRFFVEQEMELLPASSELKNEIRHKVLAKANGNFLWVTLALNEILQCLSPEEIEDTLEGIPTGMGELYHRMENSLVRSLRPVHKTMAIKILSWATCSRRPLDITELSEALQPGVSVFDLKHTIVEACGQFVIVDQSSSKVTMVHQTAADFLKKTPGLSLSVIPSEAHEKLFSKCITFLQDQPQRRPSGHVDTRAFLNYAATSWAYHLRLSSPTSDNILNLLVKFLRSQFVLRWISALAQLEQLKELVHASKTLAKYVQHRRKIDSTTSPLLHRLDDIELVELWATDMNKIVGKFTNALLDDPSTIYKLIPPFCAKESMIYRQFGENSSLTIDGLSCTAWDDNLAKIIVSPGSRATSIVCSGQHFAVLTSARKIVVYDATTFEELRTIQHGEEVFAMSFNRGGDSLVTYGFRTTKLWHVSTGKLQLEVPCPVGSRAMEIGFSVDDSKILIGSTDRRIRALTLHDLDAGWLALDDRLLQETATSDRVKHRLPCWMAFNADVSCVAVAYRNFPLSVWCIEPPEMVDRCIRNKATKTWTPVDRMIWHPTSGEVLGRYMDGSVFKWNPYDGTHQEINAAASLIACSPEGTLFATADVNGKLQLYNFQHFTLVYQLSNTGFSSDLAFGLDSRRIYDLRGQFCNVWEPNALIRLIDVDEHDSEIGSESGGTGAISMISEAWADTRDPVTAIAVQPTGDHYAVGNEAGLVQVFSKGRLVSDIWRSCNEMTAVHLDWGADGEHVAIFELGGKIHVQRLMQPVPSGRADSWTVDMLVDLKVEVEVGGVQQIMLSATSKELLVSNRTSVKIWSVETRANLVTQILSVSASPRKWINHPTNPGLLLSFEIGCIKVYRWQDLVEVKTMTYSDPIPIPYVPDLDARPTLGRLLSSGSVDTADQVHRKIKRLFLSPSKSHIILQHTHSSPNQRRQQHTAVFESASFDSLDTNPDREITPVNIPKEVQAQIEIPLCVLAKQKFVFLDKTYWMCTWHLGGSKDGRGIRRLFFLPRDWLNMDCLALCTMLADGTFLYPKNGEVASIKSEVGSEW